VNIPVGNISDYNELIQILKNKSIRTVYQPIVSLDDGHVLGYEALSRGPCDSFFESPGNLFHVAEHFNRLWELELLCRTKALENARELPTGKLLFINVNPEVIKDRKFKKGSTKDYISKFGMNPSNIIFEITEKTAVSDYKSFRKTIDNYISQGYKIAIDDTGAGYSGLRLLTETRPQYIKIDMALVRDIDKESIKQELMKTFYSFAKITNMQLIAEGIETINELNTLIDIGVQYGQGYFLQRPVAEFTPITQQVKEKIISRYRLKVKTETDLYEMKIGEIARIDKAIETTSSIGQVNENLQNSQNLQGLVVCNQTQPVGLIMKSKLDMEIALRSKSDGFLKEDIGKIMEKNPLILDYFTSLQEACRKVAARSDGNIYDYLIVTKNNEYYGIVSVRRLLTALNDRIEGF
jgi:EAL domain-containing protein (putative c-di-GMP-specific phosphodiesterase class I)/CBS domain-containing protein